MSIPDWSYSEEYYAELLRPTGFEIRTDPVKGKGLFAKRAFKEGDIVWRERALCCAQNVDQLLANVPVCQHCLASLESPRDVVVRVAGKKLASGMPAMPEGYRPPHREPCRMADKGCPLQFCSPKCEEDAWREHHSVLCPGTMTPEQRTALNDFLHEDWVQDGVDFTDTHGLALRFISLAVARSRRGMPLEQAYAPIAQLIRAPISKFAFTYLLADDYEAEVLKPKKSESDAQRQARRWATFQKYKADQSNDPAVIYAKHASSRTKQGMLERACQLLAAVFDWAEDERAFYSPQRFSELLGAVLLNGQERSPNSEYVMFVVAMRKTEQSRAALAGFHKKLKAAGTTPTTLDSSTHGQGIYPVGACFNHNCSPNIEVSYVEENNETLLVTAKRDIAAGEELCISYIDEDAPVQQRQQQLFEHYLFDCTCDSCKADLARLQAAGGSSSTAA